MAKSLGVEVKSVKRAIPLLEAAGYIRVTKAGRCNVYEIVLDEKTGDIKSPVEPPIGDISDADRGHFPPTIGDTNGPLTLKDNSKENPENICAGANLNLDFEKWFAAYPRQASKPEARKEYERVIRKGLATIEQLQFGAETYAAERAGEDMIFTTKPAKWLSNEGWLDPPVPKHSTNGFATIAARSRRFRNDRAQGPVDVTPNRTRDSTIVAGMGRAVENFRAARNPDRDIMAAADRLAEEGFQFSPRPAGLVLDGAPARPSPRSPAPRGTPIQRPLKPDPKGGQYEMEILARIGEPAFSALSQAKMDDLRARWPRREVSDAELDGLKLSARKSGSA